MLQLLRHLIFEQNALEATMLACFSVSWFFAIARSIRSRTTGSKSIWFLWIIFTGYAAGVLHKHLVEYKWTIWLYSFNALMVFIDILLYYRNSRYERAGQTHLWQPLEYP